MKRSLALTLTLLLSSCALFPKSKADSLPINFHKVNDYLFRSGELTEENIKNLHNYNIVTILSLDDYSLGDMTAKQEEAWAKAEGFNWIWFPLSNVEAPDVDQLYYALSEITKVKNLPVLVHCHSGVDRTGLVVAAYRIKEDDWTVEEAIKELRGLGHHFWLWFWDDVLYDI
jgi:protein tyrosine/serine phosphatase